MATTLAANKKKHAKTGLIGFLAKLQSIKIGGGPADAGQKVGRRQLAFILANLATLVENGVSLPKALLTLSRERSLKKYSELIEGIRLDIESGLAFSKALETHPATFTNLMVNQIRVGEQSGTIAQTLRRIVRQLEQANQLRSRIMKKLSYPMIVVGAGALVIAFMLTFIVPVFEETYRKAKVPLPAPTQLLVSVGHFSTHYGWVVVLGTVAAAVVYIQLRRNHAIAAKMDRAFLRVPVLGPWLRDLSVLQFMEVLGTMLDSGFKLVDALGTSVGSISNRAVRDSAEQLRAAIVRGERLSREVDRMGDLFPPIVSQLVIVGEQSGELSKAVQHIREHLEKTIERKADAFVGAIEPILTIGMAACIGGILLAIYLPMFSMMEAIGG